MITQYRMKTNRNDCILFKILKNFTGSFMVYINSTIVNIMTPNKDESNNENIDKTVFLVLFPISTLTKINTV